MASRWAHLRGIVPEKKTERQEDVEKKIVEYGEKTLDELTKIYNEKWDEDSELSKKQKALKVEFDALEILLQKRMDIDKADAYRMNGFTWSQKTEPYPSAEDPAAIVEYFKTHGMEDQLTLTVSELASRLKSFVKAEADNNELQVEIKTVQIDGQDVEVTEVRSQIPGVKVFLKNALSRVKSGKGA